MPGTSWWTHRCTWLRAAPRVLEDSGQYDLAGAAHPRVHCDVSRQWSPLKVRYIVDGVDRAKDFYHDLLGFEVAMCIHPRASRCSGVGISTCC